MNIGVNDGHTIRGYGTGAVGKINESVQTRIVGAEVRRLLKAAGHNAINCTVDYADSVNQSLSLIMDQANRLDLDWFVSIHFNDGGGQGTEAYTYGGRQYQDAIDVCKNIASLGFKNRGVKDGKGLYVIRRTKAKSMLIEVCFVDTADANHYLELGYKTIAKAIVEGILGQCSTPSIPAKLTDKRFPRNGTITGNGVNVRVDAGTGFDIVSQKNKGDIVRVIGAIGLNWYAILLDNKTRYVSSKYIKLD